MSGDDLDRFSRYSFGTFDNRLRGLPVGADSIRPRRGPENDTRIWDQPAGQGGRLFRFRVRCTIQGLERGLRNYTGVGGAAEVPAAVRDAARRRMGLRVSRRQFRRDAGHAGVPCERLQGVLDSIEPWQCPRGCPMSRAVLVLSLFARGRRPVGAAQQTFRTAIDLVHFGVVVTDKQGSPITGSDGRRFRDQGSRQAANDQVLRRRRSRGGSAASSRVPARCQRQHGGGPQGRPHRRHQVSQHDGSGRGHHAGGLRHRGPHGALFGQRVRAPDRAHPPAQG